MQKLPIVVLALAACLQQKPPPPPPPPVAACPGAFKELPDSLKESGGECVCPLGFGSGNVWGSGPYTEDSQLCRAAVHAGAVDPAKGGPVKFKGAAGCDRFKGSAKNGVTTSSWRAFPKSFVFPGHGEAACAPAVADECPATFPGTDLLRCTCTEEGLAEGGSVWGSGVYTADSSLCRAALHAGAVGPTGGKITVRSARGCARFVGSQKNGVTTNGWGPYVATFYLEDYGTGDCPELPKDACPDTFLAIPGSDTVKSFTCNCPADSGGTVWGTGVYTRDSSLCGAAVHAGAVTAAGGKITVYPAKACRSYEGSERNGLKSNGWGPYANGSFAFDAVALSSCPR